MSQSSETILCLYGEGGMLVNDERKKMLIELLGEVDPGKPLGTELFNALARISVNVAHEAVALRRYGGEVEVYLVQRDASETVDPKRWYCPGSFVRSGERKEDTLRRIAAREFHGSLMDFRIFHEDEFWDPRGWCISRWTLVSVDLNPEARGSWFPVSALPAPMVEYHASHVIPLAVKVFLEGNR